MLAGVPAHTVWRNRRNQRHWWSFWGDEKATSNRLNSKAENSRLELLTQAELLPLGELNNCLEVLAALFPDVRAEVFREMLLSFSKESRLELVIDQLIKHKAKWVKGRWRVQKQRKEVSAYKYRTDQSLSSKTDGISEADKFRTKAYRLAVKATLLQEFKRLSTSTVDAVLAECNHSYTDARPILLALSSKSWKRSLIALFTTRQEPPTLTEHPLISWHATESGCLSPALRSTASEELDKELYASLIAPIKLKLQQEQVAQDAAFASELNERQAEETDDLFDCDVCFAGTTFERLTVCNIAGHYICYQCVQLTIREALYGQGWARSIDSSYSTLKCIAPTSTKDEDCAGCVASELVKQALGISKEGLDLWRMMEERVASESLHRSQMPLSRCPSCYYAEADRITANISDARLIIASLTTASIFLLTLSNRGAISHYVALMTLLLIWTATLVHRRTQTWRVFTLAKIGHGNKNSVNMSTEKFKCLNPRCGRITCLTCKQDWRDVHRCYDSEKLALRAYVESAMADAVKRTCPKCNLSFVKSEACNKMTCICGYQMCYVCRKEITRREGYTHFCQHFRINPGDCCSECNRCDLYRTEDEDILIERAKERAEREWRDREGFEGGWQWNEHLPDL